MPARLALVLSAAVVLIGSCGDEGSPAQPNPTLFGAWALLSIEAEGLDTTCPGEIELTATEAVSCGTETLMLNADGTFSQVETTEEAGDPFDYRTEGNWTAGDTILTLFYRREGTDVNNLQPIEPTQVVNALWGLDGATLTIWMPTLSPPFTNVTATLEKR